uniref:hypothetical protein n=1 Tax=Shewanella sp. TaxID=50422 RepID=UPI004048C69F
MSTIKADNIATLAGVSTSMANAVNGSAKAWVNFNGTGTVAIRRAFNVSSITDLGTGYYQVNFTNAMADTNFCGTAWDDFYGTGWSQLITSPSFIQTKRYANSAYYDPVTCCVTIFS